MESVPTQAKDGAVPVQNFSAFDIRCAAGEPFIGIGIPAGGAVNNLQHIQLAEQHRET